MTLELILKAKRVIEAEVRRSIPGIPVEITIEEDADSRGGNVECFQQALARPDTQEFLASRGNTVRLRVINPISEVRDYMLANLRKISNGIAQFQTFSKDAYLYYKAMKTPEVLASLQQRNNKIQIQVLDDNTGNPEPQILIASYEDIANGRLKHFT